MLADQVSKAHIAYVSNLFLSLSHVCLRACALYMPAQVSKKRTKNGQQPAKSAAVSVSKKNGRRVLKSVAKEVAGYRPDLKVGGWGRREGVLLWGVAAAGVG
jgi:hypothetical protein